MQEPQMGDLPVGPVPTQTTVAVAQGGGASFVVLQVVTPQGVSVFFLSPEHARDLAGHLESHASTAASGLVIAGAGSIPTTDGPVGL